MPSLNLLHFDMSLVLTPLDITPSRTLSSDTCHTLPSPDLETQTHATLLLQTQTRPVLSTQTHARLVLETGTDGRRMVRGLDTLMHQDLDLMSSSLLIP